MEIGIKGEGKVTVRFIDRDGRALIQQSMTASGSPTIQARMTVSLTAKTSKGEVALAPVLMPQANPKQEVMFDSKPPSLFTKIKCQEMGCSAKITKEAAQGQTQSLEREDIATLFSDENLPKLDRPEGGGHCK